MNIHPLIVHFPIAFLSLYAIFELIRVKRLVISREWRYIKATLLVLGLIGALAAAATGDFGKSLFPGAHQVIALHELVAKMTIVIFGVLAAIVVIGLFDEWFGVWFAETFGGLWRFIMRVRNAFASPIVMVALAAIGLILLVVTGILGAAIVYGPTGDVFISAVYGLFFKQ